jgi:NAD(P)H-dependent flavin oxidoreductase YrpB (nitropropane dioxygenase family)
VSIETRFTEMFGCRHPVQQAGMGGVASPDLALAVSAAGGMGMLSGTTGIDSLQAQLDRIPADATVGVNFLVPFLEEAALDEAARCAVLVELFWGAPDTGLVARARADGARVGWQVGSVSEACAARDAGCDVVVVQGYEAGGHVRGTTGLVPLLDEVQGVVDIPIVAAGGIGSGAAMAAALAAGADAVRIGTRFVASTESVAHPAYVDALVAATAEDTVVTTAFGDGWPGAPHRVLASCVKAGKALGDEQSWSPLWPDRDHRDRVEASALYAGQSVGAVRARQSAAEIVSELVGDAERHLRSRLG